jgi:hypothetical protein
MNNRKLILTALVALIASLAATSVFAAPRTPNPKAYPVDKVLDRNGQMVAAVGIHENTVRYNLGRPDDKIAPNVWVFTGFKGNAEPAQKDCCEYLVVTFQERRVADIKLVNCCAFRTLAGDPNRGFKTSPVAHVAGK